MQSRKLSVSLMIVNFILILATLAINFRTIVIFSSANNFDSSVYGIVRLVKEFLKAGGMILALCYLLVGTKKNSAVYFSWFLRLITIIQFLSLVFIEPQKTKPLMILYLALNGLSFGCLCILSVARDIGKRKTYIITGIALLCAVLKFAVNHHGAGILLNLGNMLAAIVLQVSMMLKYIDKSLRGSK